MKKLPFDITDIFSINTEDAFLDLSLQIFRYQYENNRIYRQYCELIKTDSAHINQLEDIPFLPISFFKSHHVKAFKGNSQLSFESSGTTGQQKSTHTVFDETIYQLSFIKGFEYFFGPIEDYCILGLLPSYHDNDSSSLIYMVDHLIQLTNDPDSAFLLNDYEKLIEITKRKKAEKKVVIIGVSYALLHLAEKYQPDLSGCHVIETGGMKGKRKELTKPELHQALSSGLNLPEIQSEYGMTELLSQAYSLKNGTFNTPPWMKILIREHNDPFHYTAKKTGGINVIDLANVYSCSFIATQDLGRINSSGFEVLGRFDNSDIRGCNLLIQ